MTKRFIQPRWYRCVFVFNHTKLWYGTWWSTIDDSWAAAHIDRMINEHVNLPIWDIEISHSIDKPLDTKAQS